MDTSISFVGKRYFSQIFNVNRNYELIIASRNEGKKWTSLNIK